MSDLKNATDLALVVDCTYNTFVMELDTIVIFAGDGGYGPLVNCLVDNLRKKVVVYSVKGTEKTEVYNRLRDNHHHFDVEFNQFLIDCVEKEIDPNLVKLAMVIDGLHKKYSTVIRNGLYQYILRHPDLSKLGEQGCSDLLDEARKTDLFHEIEPIKSDTGNPQRQVQLNYRHPIVRELNLNL